MRQGHHPIARGVLALAAAVAFIEAVLFSLLAPLLPQFEKTLDLSGAGVGVLVAAYAIGAFAAAFPSIAIAKRIGVKPTVMIAFFVLAVATLGLGFAESLPSVIASRFLQGVGSALGLTGAIAWLTGVTDRSLRAEAIGTAFSAAFAGALLGPVLGAAAASLGRAVIFTAVAIGAAALGLMTLGLDPPSRSRTDETPPFTQIFRDGTARVGIWLILVAGMLLGVVGVLVPLQLDDLGWGAVAIGAVFATAAVIQMFASPRLGRFADSHGRVLVIRVALVAAASMLVVLAIDDYVWFYAVTAVAVAIAIGSLWTPSLALLADTAEQRGFDQSTAAGLMNVAWAPGFAIGGAVAGVLVAQLGNTLPCVLMSAVCLGSLALLRVADVG
ncbi:MAG: MFS transporter [Thermoleophilia bacterium]|nr:MFS transporter [Thermoleophilia bacterium]